MTIFAMLQMELDDEYLATVRAHLFELKFNHGVLISARLGKGNKGADYVVRRPNGDRRPWLERLFGKRPPGYTFRLHERDEAGARALSELNDRGIAIAATALAQSNDHILSLFRTLRTELAFYIACLNLHERLTGKGEPTCFPVPLALTERGHAARDLYDVCLSRRSDRRAAGNDLEAGASELVMITGPTRAASRPSCEVSAWPN